LKLLTPLFLIVLFGCTQAADNTRNGKKNPRATPSTPEIVLPLGAEVIKSQSYRKKGSSQLSYDKQNQNIIDDKEDNYRAVPNPNYDYDARVTYVGGSEFGEIETDCGSGATFSKILDRITDCKNKNIGKNAWSSVDNGISGEGDWYLVVKDGAHSIWQDETTGLLWSSQLKPTAWKQASGVDTDIQSDDFICNSIDYFTAEEVSWRLPTRNEFLLADINGARFVLPFTEYTYWTSSKVGNNNNAWTIHQADGKLLEADIVDQHFSRCIGFVKK
jgi:hypothetical protein